jgi:hypothetical protein
MHSEISRKDHLGFNILWPAVNVSGRLLGSKKTLPWILRELYMSDDVIIWRLPCFRQIQRPYLRPWPRGPPETGGVGLQSREGNRRNIAHWEAIWACCALSALQGYCTMYMYCIHVAFRPQVSTYRSCGSRHGQHSTRHKMRMSIGGRYSVYTYPRQPYKHIQSMEKSCTGIMS